MAVVILLRKLDPEDSMILDSLRCCVAMPSTLKADVRNSRKNDLRRLGRKGWAGHLSRIREGYNRPWILAVSSVTW